MNKSELVREISQKTKISQKSVSEILAATIDTIQSAVKKGNRVTLIGFGAFESRKRAARKAINPRTGVTLKIAAKTVPAFVAGKKFKEFVK